jgi:hypothetical protein
MAEGMEANVAKQQAEKAVILVQGSAIPNSNGINRDRKTLTYRKL